MKGTGAKRNVCPFCPVSCVSTGAKFPVAPIRVGAYGHHHNPVTQRFRDEQLTIKRCTVTYLFMARHMEQQESGLLVQQQNVWRPNFLQTTSFSMDTMSSKCHWHISETAYEDIQEHS